MPVITLNEWNLAKISKALREARRHCALANVHLDRWAERWGQP